MERTGAPLAAPPVRSLHGNGSAAAAVFALLLAAYLFTYTGTIQSSDGLSMFATAESLVRRGSADSNQLLWTGLQQGSFGPDGNLYSRKGAGAVWLALPLVAPAQMAPGFGLAQAALLLNPLLTAWTGALIFLTGMRLGWRRGQALLAALGFGLCTLAWPYTQELFSDPATGWANFAAIYCLVAYAATRRGRYLWLAGAAWGLAYLTRSLHLVTLPFFGLAAWAVARGAGQNGAKGQVPWRELAAFALPVALAGALSLWWNYLRYGSLLESGYLEIESFSGDWGFGIFGLLAGPARGLIWYSPSLLCAIPGARTLWRQARWPVALILATSAVYLLAYGKWFMWHGGFSWGPRFLTPLLPGLALLAAPAWAALLPGSGASLPARVGVAVAFAASLATNALGLLAPFGLAQDWLAENVTPLFARETFTQLRYSPLALQPQMVRPETIHLAWWRGRDAALAAAPALAAIVAAAALVRSRGRAAGAAVAAASLLVAVMVVARVTAPACASAQGAAAGRIGAFERAGDAAVHQSPLDTQRFASCYHGRLPVYGLPDPTQDGWLARIRREHTRLWVISQQSGRPGWEEELQQVGYVLLDENEGDTRLALYQFERSGAETVARPGKAFGPAITLGEAAFLQDAAPGDGITIELFWQALATPGKEYRVFVHLLDAAGQRVAQSDAEPAAWTRPTSTWVAGETIRDRHALLLPLNAAPGEYTLIAGLYDAATGERPAEPAVLGVVKVQGK